MASRGRGSIHPNRQLAVALLVTVVVIGSSLGLSISVGNPKLIDSGTTPILPPVQNRQFLGRPSVPESFAHSPNDLIPLTPAPASGRVVRTIFPGYNASLALNFLSEVSGWQVGTPAYVPATGTIWLPQYGIAIPDSPFPTFSPAAIFNPSIGQFIGLDPYASNLTAFAFDPGDGLLYATEPANNSVVAINPSTGSIAGPIIPVGTDPDAIVYDPGSGYIFVANKGSSNLTVISGTSSRILFPSVTVGSEPTGLAVDSGDGLLFVANSNSDFVSVIDVDSPATPLPSVPLAFGPGYDVAYSSLTRNVLVSVPSSVYATLIHASPTAVITSLVDVGQDAGAVATNLNGSEFVVANSSGSNLVSVNSSLGAIIDSNIQTGGSVIALVLDPSTGSLYSWGTASSRLWSTNLTSETSSAASSSVDPGPDAVGYDQISDATYIGGSSGRSLFTVNSTTFGDSHAPQSLSSGVLAVVVDASKNVIFVGTETGVTILNGSSGLPSGTVAGVAGASHQLLLDSTDGILWDVSSTQGVVGVNLTSLTLTIDPGIPITSSSATSIALDSTARELFVVDSSSSVAVLNSSTGQVMAGVANVGTNLTCVAYDSEDGEVYVAGDGVTIISPAADKVVAGPIPIGGTHTTLSMVYDSSRTAMLITTESKSPSFAGELLILNGSSVSSGADGYTTVVVGNSPGDITDVLLEGSQAPGSAEIWVANNRSGTLSVVADPLQITYFSATPESIDIGQSTLLELQFNGGAGPSRVAFEGLPPGCYASMESELNCTPTASGNFTIEGSVTDTLGFVASANATVVVSRALEIRSSLSPGTLPILDVGSELRGNASGIGGNPPYSFNWWFGDGSESIEPDTTHSYANPGSYVVTVEIRDSVGATNQSTFAIIVVPRPIASVMASPGPETDVGIPLQFRASVTGGAGESEQLWKFDDGNESQGMNASHEWTRPGNYSVSFEYTDALGATANASITVFVHPSLTAVFRSANGSSTNPAFVDAPVTFASTISGGTSPYVVSWAFGDGTLGYGILVTHSYASLGSYVVAATLTDAAGATLRANLTITVVTSPTTSSLPALTGGFASGAFLGLLLGGVVAAVVLFAVGSRAKKRPPSGPVSPYVPP